MVHMPCKQIFDCQNQVGADHQPIWADYPKKELYFFLSTTQGDVGQLAAVSIPQAMFNDRIKWCGATLLLINLTSAAMSRSESLCGKEITVVTHDSYRYTISFTLSQRT